ncbi:hypothetical protein D5045_06570 [Verminephrobacter eiseniae]|nr:hypothetical protein [Verminephrobacter eiseniae]
MFYEKAMKFLIAWIAVMTVLTRPSWTTGKIRVLGVGQRMALLREVRFPDLLFPRWQSVLVISLIGMLIGLNPILRAALPDVSAPWRNVVVELVAGLLLIWAAFLVMMAVLRWWLKRGGRWDGQGDLFNLVAASWLVADTLVAGYASLAAPPFLIWHLFLPLWLYSLWVGAKAMASAIPQASLGYCIAGIAIGLVPAIAAAGLVFALVVMAMTGLASVGAGA